MENRDSKECHDIVKQLTDNTISIEHVMPQTLSDKWKDALCGDWEHIYISNIISTYTKINIH